MSTPKTGGDSRLELMMSKSDAWAEAMRNATDEPKRALEPLMIAAFANNNTPKECLDFLRDSKEGWRHILNSLSKLKRMRTSPIHTREYQSWRWWVDRLGWECRWRQAREQDDWQGRDL
jgi:hypothetical protein